MKIEKQILECAIDATVQNGDTDIFPYPFELKFLEDCRNIVSEELAKLEMNNYSPMSLLEALVPKSKFGFRTAHQPYPIDTVLYTALVMKIFDAVEEGRDSISSNRAFSYRKLPGLDPHLFVPERTYRNWLEVIEGKVFSTKYSHVIRTDISDYYSRIYRHRLENILDSLSGDARIVKRIEKFISDWRGGQSFGLPVGSNASRLLAEAALNDTDMALISEDFEHTRYVDDIVIFVKHEEDPYAILGFLARHLSQNEGLSLNIQKTKILEWNNFIETMGAPDGVDDDARENFATEKLFWAAYGNDELGSGCIDFRTAA